MREIAIVAEGLGKQYYLTGSPPRRAHAALEDLLQTMAGKGKVAVKEAFWALKDCSFTLHFGEMVALLGRNGAGKSVLLRILSRITKPTTGTAQISGRLVSLLEVGSGFHPELSGRENVLLSGAILGLRRTDIVKKLEEIVAFSEIGRFLDEPVKHYSSGMYSRLAFSVAAHVEADILLIDEVLAVGDEAFQGKCVEQLRRARDRGVAVLLVSHSMLTVSRLCTRGLFLEHGRMVFDGAVDEAIRRYNEQTSGLDDR